MSSIPIVYKFDRNMKPIPPSGDRQTASQVHMNGLFLEKPGLLKEALKREEEWMKQVPGYNATLRRNKDVMTSLERSLYKLRAQRELAEWAGQFFDPNSIEDDGNDGNMGRPIQIVEDKIWEEGMNELSSGGQFDPDSVVFHETNALPSKYDDEDQSSTRPFPNLLVKNQPCIKAIPSASLVPGMGRAPIRQDAIIVIIRHGKTEHNKLGLFVSALLTFNVSARKDLTFDFLLDWMGGCSTRQRWSRRSKGCRSIIAGSWY